MRTVEDEYTLNLDEERLQIFTKHSALCIAKGSTAQNEKSNPIIRISVKN